MRWLTRLVAWWRGDLSADWWRDQQRRECGQGIDQSCWNWSVLQERAKKGDR